MRIIELNRVSKSYDHNRTKVLNGISIKINTGERAVILGPSGCGKTTILRLIAGFIAPDSGSIVINGKTVAKDGAVSVEPEYRNIGMVFQDLALWPHLTVRGNIEFPLKSGGVPKKKRSEKIEEILELVGMKGFGSRKPAELSGGQRQRVALARALAPEPAVLLMDEPLSSLDDELNLRIRKEILRLHDKLGFTLLYVTHNRNEAYDIATRVVMMKKGRIGYDGSPDILEKGTVAGGEVDR